MQHLGFGSLWLQVVIVAVATFALSGLSWNLAPWHRTEVESLRGVPMGPRLAKTFAFYFFVAFFTAYCLRQAFEPGTAYMQVFQLAGCISLAAHAFGHVHDAIWFGKPCQRVTGQFVDSVGYALVTAGIYASMWPR